MLWHHQVTSLGKCQPLRSTLTLPSRSSGVIRNCAYLPKYWRRHLNTKYFGSPLITLFLYLKFKDYFLKFYEIIDMWTLLPFKISSWPPLCIFIDSSNAINSVQFICAGNRNIYSYQLLSILGPTSILSPLVKRKKKMLSGTTFCFQNELELSINHVQKWKTMKSKGWLLEKMA